jgi:hypothetical protein
LPFATIPGSALGRNTSLYMNRRLRGDASLNAAIREDGDSVEWQDWLVDESPDQETTLAASEKFDNQCVLKEGREPRAFGRAICDVLQFRSHP